MSGCTQIFLVTVKGNEQEIKSFKNWYYKKHPLLIRKYHPNGLKYNSEYAKVWIDNPNEFSFFIQRFWHTNTDSYYSISKLAKKFLKLEFYNTFYIQHESSRTNTFSTEGLEIFKNGKSSGTIQMAINAVNWNNLIRDGIPETMFDSFLRMNYVLELLNKPEISLFIKTRLKPFTEIDKTGFYKKPSVSFNYLVAEDIFFSEHIDDYRPIILNHLKTNKITRSTGVDYYTTSAAESILSYALKDYIQQNIPEVKTYLKRLFIIFDRIANNLLTGKMNTDVLLEYSNASNDNNIYKIFKVYEEYKITKYQKIYLLMAHVKKMEEIKISNTPLPF